MSIRENDIYLGRSPSVQSAPSEQSVLKWNTQVLITGSGQNVPAHGSEPLRSPTPVVGLDTNFWIFFEILRRFREM